MEEEKSQHELRAFLIWSTFIFTLGLIAGWYFL